MHRRTFIGAALTTLATVRSAQAGQAAVYSEHGVAIRGADAVAYFRGLGPVAGSQAEQVRWHGAVWLFATPEHREAFELNPRGFAPRFGGYCAYMLSQGRIGPTDPRAYTIHRGRLYLVRSPADREVWLANLEQNIQIAESHWPSALG